MQPADMRLTLGPVLFNWPADKWSDFYARIADEAPVDTVVVGETVCAKRLPFIEGILADTVSRLTRAGKKVIFATLGLAMTAREREIVAAWTETEDFLVEANDMAAVALRDGRPFMVGPMMNVYNERTIAFLAKRGAVRAALPAELPHTSIVRLAAASAVGIEVQAFGRIPLAISARCYHARHHGLHKDGCQFVCAEDPDGLVIETLAGEPFLAVNGVQTMSRSFLNLAAEVDELAAAGVRHLRLSPQDVDMVAVAATFRELLDGRENLADANARLADISGGVAMSNGYFHARPGRAFIDVGLEDA